MNAAGASDFPPQPPPPPPVPTAGGRRAGPRRRCVRHEEREAVARCVACGGGFCRECITEHEDRLYCGPCFARSVGRAAAPAPARVRVNWSRLRGAAATAGSLLCLLTAFYLLGRALVLAPAEFHEGEVWKETFLP